MDHFYRIIEVTIPIILFFLGNRMLAKKEQKAVHQENSNKLDALLREREEWEPHDHDCPNDGREGALTYDGIQRKRRRAGVAPLL